MPLLAPVEAAAVPAPPDAARMRRRRWRRPLPLTLLVVLVVAAAVALRLLPRFTRPPAEHTLKASGRIEGRDVTVAPKDIQGRVTRLFVDEGQTVTQGQVLGELEANALDARAASLNASIGAIDVQIRQASLDVELTIKNTDAAIASTAAGVNAAQAHLDRARAILENADGEFERASSLFVQKVISKRELDQADTARRTSGADVDGATRDLARAQAELTLARAARDTVALKRQQVLALQESRRVAEGQLRELQASLAERQIVAPIDGTILSRPVEVGEVVSPGSPLFQLVDLSRLYVKVYIPEPDIPKIKLGDPAYITVDAFRDRAFAARVSKIYDEAEFTPKSVETEEERLKLVFGVELTFVNPNGVLKPGMPADCVIHWTPPPPVDPHGS